MGEEQRLERSRSLLSVISGKGQRVERIFQGLIGPGLRCGLRGSSQNVASPELDPRSTVCRPKLSILPLVKDFADSWQLINIGAKTVRAEMKPAFWPAQIIHLQLQYKCQLHFGPNDTYGSEGERYTKPVALLQRYTRPRSVIPEQKSWPGISEEDRAVQKMGCRTNDGGTRRWPFSEERNSKNECEQLESLLERLLQRHDRNARYHSQGVAVKP